MRKRRGFQGNFHAESAEYAEKTYGLITTLRAPRSLRAISRKPRAEEKPACRQAGRKGAWVEKSRSDPLSLFSLCAMN